MIPHKKRKTDFYKYQYTAFPALCKEKSAASDRPQKKIFPLSAQTISCVFLHSLPITPPDILCRTGVFSAF